MVAPSSSPPIRSPTSVPLQRQPSRSLVASHSSLFRLKVFIRRTLARVSRDIPAHSGNQPMGSLETPHHLRTVALLDPDVAGVVHHGTAHQLLPSSSPGAWLYSSSLTCLPQETELPVSSASCMAMCVINRVGVAPCQWFSPGSKKTQSPGRMTSIGPPSL